MKLDNLELKAEVTSKTIASLSEYFSNGFRCAFNLVVDRLEKVRDW